MRQNLGQKKINRYKRETGLDIVGGAVRGGTDHRKDLFLRDGRIIYYWPRTGRSDESPVKWKSAMETPKKWHPDI